MSYYQIDTCRSCRSTLLDIVLDLGVLPISDFPLDPKDLVYAPLQVVQCKTCGLVQLHHTVDRNLIYNDTYWYKSGTNESMVQSLRDIVEDVMSFVELKPDDYVLDIGCNDGTLLSFYPRWLWAQGFEPAKSMVKEAVRTGHARIFNAYFPPRWTIETKYKIITSIAQFYNTQNLNSYVRTIKGILHPDGVWCIQMAYLPDTLATNNLGDFCHEHLTFWTLSALQYLLIRHGLKMVAVETNSVNGGSIRVMVKHGVGSQRPEVELDFDLFRHRLSSLKQGTLELLTNLRDQGKGVIGLGASTKNNTILSYYGIGPDLIQCFSDRQESKAGRYTVTGIPIVTEDSARRLNPDYYFVGPFHFLESLKNREKDFLNRGGKLIVPFPTLCIEGV